MSFDSLSPVGSTGCFPKRALTISAPDDMPVHAVTVYLYSFNPERNEDILSIDFHKRATTEELIERIISTRSGLSSHGSEDFEMFEMMGTLDGKTFKERKLDRGEYPVAVQTLWNRLPSNDEAVPKNRFVLRRKGVRPQSGGVRIGSASSTIDSFLAKFLTQPPDREYPDLCMLPELTEQTLLDNLRDRFNSGHIYTYIGPILVAVNPFSFFPIYNPKYSLLYCQNRRLGMLPPHIFAIADITYHNMLRIQEHQCVVISGESGSGKTESTNFLLHHLTTLSKKEGNQGCSIESTLLSAGPVLEAFGNALTVQNNNSSRFGKFIKVNYRENGMVSGANVEIYLLEKSRIISQAIGERNYHVFYYLLEGAPEEDRRTHFLLKPGDYNYLNQNAYEVLDDGEAEKYEYMRLMKSMDAVGFPKQTQSRILSILSAVLLLGNINYIKRQGYHSDETAYIENEEIVCLVAQMLSINADDLLQALTMRRTVTKNDTVVSRYSVSEATNTRDAMAKYLYNALFHWIVLRVNQALLKGDASSYNKGHYIGILDIFGFEDVGAEWNSFEQLCINYANEHLQAYFNQHIFQFEQEEYLREGIYWTHIEYTDNRECVHLFQAKPYGMFRLIDEESNIHNGTDQSMLDKLNQFLKNHEYYEMPQKRENAFIIAHYAGKVKYQIKGFREKNKDLMRQDVLIAIKNSQVALVRELIGADPVAVHRWNLVRAAFRALHAFKQAGQRLERSESSGHLSVSNEKPAHNRRGSDSQLSAFLRGDLIVSIPDFCDTSMFSTIANQAKKSMCKTKDDKLGTLKSLQLLRDMGGRKPVTAKPASVSRQFEYSLSRLMGTLSLAKPYFIRCIKSNNEKIANNFDDNIILRQLRYTGMLETVRIRRAGYSVRIEYRAFIKQYRILLDNGRDSTMHDVKKFINEHPLIDSNNVQYGVTKVFMRDAEKLMLDDHLHRTIMQHIDTLQRWFRTVLARKKYQRMRQGVIRIQAMFRGMSLRNKLRQQSYAAMVIQTTWRRYREEKKFNLLRETVVALQSAFRGAEARKNFGEIPKKGANKFHITKIQTFQLPKFDLSNPGSLAEFATSSDDYSSSSEDGLDESVSDGSVLGDFNENIDDDNIELDVTFTLEDTKLKLIEESPDSTFHRRQSLAATASTAKLKMLRRAASTESEHFMKTRTTDDSLHESPTAKKKGGSGKIGFMKAKKNLKALFGRRSDSVQEASDDEEAGTSCELHPPDTLPEHSLKISRLHRAEPCSLCNKTLTGLLVQAHKCTRCKLTFHKECSSFATHIPCHPSSPIRSPTRREPPRRPWDIRQSKPNRLSVSPASPKDGLGFATFNLTKTKQQSDPLSMIVECTEDLRLFSVFMFKKQANLDQDKKKRDTIVDAIFKKSLREFHMEMLGYEAILTEDKATLRYKDLISTFEGLLTKVSREEKVTFPTTLGVNAFRGFLNEFMQQQSKQKKGKQKTGIIRSYRKKRRRSDVTVLHNGHRFRADFVHVPTYCELCNQFMWHAEKIFICIACRISCHKKCHTKITQMCKLAQAATSAGRFFGASLVSLADDEQGIPIILNKMFIEVELRSLFVEGLYRKSGSIAQVRSARKTIETAPNTDCVNLEDLPVHVLTTLIKAFFRELPGPLITYDLYENFLNVSEVPEATERIRCLSVMVELLPKYNKSVLDRLMYHLARVAHQEAVNKMGAYNLALIFGPCIMRRQDTVHAQEQLKDVNRQAICVQTLIEEKLRQYRATLNNIVELEHASEKVVENLRKIEEHRKSLPIVTTEVEQCKQLFEEQLDFLHSEKEKLMQELPPMAPVASSEDLSSSDERSFSPPRDVEYAVDFDTPPVFGMLAHPNKNRTRGPMGRRPPRPLSKVVFFNPSHTIEEEEDDDEDVHIVADHYRSDVY